MRQTEDTRYGWLESESKQYQQARRSLHAAERELRDQRERVAALRRDLPLETPVGDYSFIEAPADLDAASPIRKVTLAELVTPDRPAVFYQFMYGRAQKKPCPMCSMWIDGFSGVARHLPDTMTFAVIAAAPVNDLREWGANRGWHGLRLLSCAETSFKRDLHFEDPDGTQLPGITVFARNASGELCHFYSVSAILAEKEYRGIDLLTPIWNLLDLTPAGRGNWVPTLQENVASTLG